MADYTPPFLNDEWLQLQERYWKAWADLSGFPSGGGGPYAAPNANPWNQALDQWWQAVSPALPTAPKDFMDHLVEQGKGFFRLSENLLKSLMETSKVAGSTEEWQRLFQKMFEDMRTAAGASTPQGRDTLSQMLAFWELPMDNWQRTMSVMSGMPGDFMQPFKSLTLHQQAGPVREQLNRFLSVPGVGYAREHQEQYQKFGQLFVDYQASLEAYGEEYAKMAASSVQHFQDAVMATVERKESVDSMQGLYNLWVDACEEAYAERAFSEDYAKAHGRLVNSLMALKKQGQALVDEMLGMLNMPTREDLCTLQEGLQAMRREVRRLEARIGRSDRAAAAPPPGTTPSAHAPAAASTRKKAAPARGRAKKVVKKARAKTAKQTESIQRNQEDGK